MNIFPHIPARIAAISAALVPIPMIAIATVRLTHTMPTDGSITNAPEHILTASLSVALILLIPVTLYLGQITDRTRVALVAVAGQIGLSLLALIANIQGEDPSYFPPVAGVTNLAIFGGWCVLGVALRKRLGVPLWISAGLPVSWIVALIGAQFGGGLVVAVYWIAVAWLIDNDRLADGFKPRSAESRHETRLDRSTA
jgi:nitrate/nitrite transporter NarK